MVRSCATVHHDDCCELRSDSRRETLRNNKGWVAVGYEGAGCLTICPFRLQDGGTMRARTQIAIPEPKGSEFENFDRLTGILMRVKPKKKALAKRKKRAKVKA